MGKMFIFPFLANLRLVQTVRTKNHLLMVLTMTVGLMAIPALSCASLVVFFPSLPGCLANRDVGDVRTGWIRYIGSN